MAGRILNRAKLREQAEQADRQQAAGAGGAPPEPPKKKARAPRKPRAKKEPPRLRARWGVFDGTMKQVAIFDYNDRTGADAKLADLQAKKKGIHFLQIVKEPMPEPVAVEAGPLA